MIKAQIKKEVLNLRVRLDLLKHSLREQPDLAVDDINWKKVKKDLKQARDKKSHGKA